MRVRLSFKFVDVNGKASYSGQNVAENIGSKNGKNILVASYVIYQYTILKKPIRPDGSLCIVWKVEYLSNIQDLKFLPCVKGVDKLKV